MKYEREAEAQMMMMMTMTIIIIINNIYECYECFILVLIRKNQWWLNWPGHIYTCTALLCQKVDECRASSIKLNLKVWFWFFFSRDFRSYWYSLLYLPDQLWAQVLWWLLERAPKDSVTARPHEYKLPWIQVYCYSRWCHLDVPLANMVWQVCG